MLIAFTKKRIPLFVEFFIKLIGKSYNEMELFKLFQPMTLIY